MVQAWQIQGFFEAPWFYSKCEKDPWSKALSESSSNVHWGKSAPKSHKYICPGANHVSHRPQLSFKAQFSQRVSFFSNTAVEASPPLSRMYCSEIRHSFRLSTDWCALNECSREIHIIICIYEMIWGVVAMVKRLLESCMCLQMATKNGSSGNGRAWEQKLNGLRVMKRQSLFPRLPWCFPLYTA